MVKKEIVVNIENGLHARPAAYFVKVVNNFHSKVELNVGSKVIKANSILNLMGVSIQEGQRINVTVDGEDEELAMEKIEEFFNARHPNPK